MPTVIGDERKKAGEKRTSSQRAGSSKDLLCSVKYRNTLPDIPSEPKFLIYPFDQYRFVQYNPTSLERNYKHELLTEIDLGVPIDLILPETYAVPTSSQRGLHPADEALLEEEALPQTESKRARQHAKNVSWLRRTEYISTEFTRSHTSGESAETKVGYNVKKKLQGLDIYKDRASQIDAIKATFKAAQQPITKHYSKPGVEAREVLPLFPDFDLWKLPFAQVIFDTDPASQGKHESHQLEEMSHAMIRGMMDANNDQFVAYFLPLNETLKQRRLDNDSEQLYQPDQEYEYRLTKEYNWNVKNKASKGYEETYFLVIRHGQGVYYNEIETRVRLNKRRSKAKSAINSKLVVRHREMTEDEVSSQEARLSQLEPAILEEEEEEDEEGDKEGDDMSSDRDDEFQHAFSSGSEEEGD